ncbi:MAG: FtsQ-type POTRA domain-containing protein [Ruminococcaceae bacterium]|nr:FtsQ-type POTRA domain-containing protein [Oscillospiraceae bacterium]
MEQRNKKRSNRSKTKIIPPKKKRPESLSRDEVRSINKKKIIRKRKAERLAMLSALSLVVLSIGVVLILVLFFKIDTIKITGDKVYADKEIVLQSGIETGDSLIRVKEQKINDILTKNLPYVGEITIEKKLPDTLIINVSATREVVAFQSGAGFILVDAHGKVLSENASMLRDNVAVVSGIKVKEASAGEVITFSDEKTTDAFMNLLTAIKNSKIELLTDISLNKTGNWEIRYDDRITIKIPSDGDIETNMKRAVKILDTENERNPYTEGVIDLTMGDNAYFKPGAETTEPTTKGNKKTPPSTTEKSE